MTPRHPIRSATVFGAGGGIGGAVVAHLLGQPACERVYCGIRPGREAAWRDERVRPFAFSLEDEASIAAAARLIAAEGPPELVFVATGMLQQPGGTGPEKSLRMLDGAALAQQFAVNSIGPALIAKHTLPILPRDRRSLFAALSARVGSIGDNRLGGWHGYRAAKAALNMLIRTLSVEMRARWPHAILAALHPGTVDTTLSRPFQRNVDPAKLLTPMQSAAQLLTVLDRLEPADSGGFFAWDGQPIPW